MNERQQKIIEILNEKGFVTVDYLCKNLYSSGATIRRDLTFLENKTVLKRTHGGAILYNGISSDSPFGVRKSSNINEKHHIAQLATNLINNAMTIFIDSSSTSACITKYLNNFHDLSIITNGLQTVYDLAEKTNIRVFATGGQVKNNVTMHGTSALNMVSSRYADIFFFSCGGFSPEHGTSETNEESVKLKKAMFENATKRVLLCDHTKIGLTYSFKCFEVDQIDVLITDRKPSNDILTKLPSNLEIIY